MNTQVSTDFAWARQSRRIAQISALALCTLAGSVYGSPEGGEVIEGEADIDYGDWTRVVTGEITVIEWLSFQIAAGETVEFIMPSESSRVLNLINSGVPTEIMGTLLGNGQVFLVNPSGVIFGQGAVVNVGSLYAAAGNISSEDFVNGMYRFTDARGVVENRGMLEGDMIALVGGRVANHGTISAPGGTVVMAAGEQVLIGEHLGNIFVELERPSDLANTETFGNPDGVDLAAGDIFSLAAWNTGTIEAEHTNISASSGYIAIDHTIESGDITLHAGGDAYIELSSDLHATGDGITIDGDLVFGDDVMMTSSGNRGEIVFEGRVDSELEQEHDLVIDAGNGVVSFGDHVGYGRPIGGPRSGLGSSRLGVLDVRADRVDIHGNVAVNQEMNFYAPVQIMGESTLFDVGFGSSLFAESLYSNRSGASDVAFEYDGEAWVGQGEARTPFKFRKGIGQAPALGGFTVGGAFGNIRFGGDLNGPSRVSAFVFGSDAQAGLDLMSLGNTDLNRVFYVSARESITMGSGQKITSFGSLALNAKGTGETLIEIGDLNVLGDLTVRSQGRSGGTIRILDRVGGEIDYSGNENDRDLDGLFDSGTELIASGRITLDADALIVGQGGATLGSGEVVLFNNLGDGDAGGLNIDTYPGGVSSDLFLSGLTGSTGMLYGYDLTLPPEDEGSSVANLATSFVGDTELDLRTNQRVFAGIEVLQELGLNPQFQNDERARMGTRDGVHRFDESGKAEFGVTLDRLSRKSVDRLSEAYVGLLGEQRSDDDDQREQLDDVSKSIGWIWVLTQDRSIEDIRDEAQEHEADGVRVIDQIERVFDAIDLLELSPLEINRAKDEFVKMICPEQVPVEDFIAWFR